MQLIWAQRGSEVVSFFLLSTVDYLTLRRWLLLRQPKLGRPGVEDYLVVQASARWNLPEQPDQYPPGHMGSCSGNQFYSQLLSLKFVFLNASYHLLFKSFSMI